MFVASICRPASEAVTVATVVVVVGGMVVVLVVDVVVEVVVEVVVVDVLVVVGGSVVVVVVVVDVGRDCVPTEVPAKARTALTRYAAYLFTLLAYPVEIVCAHEKNAVVSVEL